MKKFVITTNRNYVEVMKKILSDCQVSGKLAPEIEKYLETLENRHKIYRCIILGNKMNIKMLIPYRNNFASTMNLEILTNGENTRINGSISSLFSNDTVRLMLVILVLVGSFGFLIIQAARFKSENLSSFDWIFIGIASIVFLSFLPTLFKRRKDKGEITADNPYDVQMSHWISNLFPGECKFIEK